MAVATNKGIIDRQSGHSVEETVEKLKGIPQAKGITLFALVDHSGEAEKVGNEDASHQVVDLREPKSGYASYVGGSQHCHRSPFEDSGLGRRFRKSLGLLQ
jgi:hypothetical protein